MSDWETEPLKEPMRGNGVEGEKNWLLIFAENLMEKHESGYSTADIKSSVISILPILPYELVNILEAPDDLYLTCVDGASSSSTLLYTEKETF